MLITYFAKVMLNEKIVYVHPSVRMSHFQKHEMDFNETDDLY